MLEHLGCQSLVSWTLGTTRVRMGLVENWETEETLLALAWVQWLSWISLLGGVCS